MQFGGDVTATRDWLVAEHGEDAVPSVRWMQKTKHMDHAFDELALNEKGAAEAKQKPIVVQIQSACRNELWLADHKQLDVLVLPPRATKPVKPWMTLIMDAKSRRVLGAALSLQPSQAHVLAALRQAIETAGTPEQLLFDRGLEFTANAICDAASYLVFAALATKEYRPDHKGKIERLAKTIGQRTVRFLAHRTTQATDLRGKPRLAFKGADGAVVEAMAFDDLTPLFCDEVDAYNNRKHSALEATPNAVYREDGTPERPVPSELLRRYLLTGDRRRIREHGVRFRNHWYYHEALDGYRGLSVEIRYSQDDLRRLEVYRGPEWWCTATLVDPAPPETHERVLAHRRQRATESAKITRRARREQKRNYEAVRSRGQRMRETTVITNADAESELRGGSDRQMAAIRRLGLHTDVDIVENTPQNRE